MRRHFHINSLFWRIFAGLLTVILATGIFVWLYSWVVQSRETGVGTIDWRRSAQKAVENALIVHRYGGREQLERWLRSPVNSDPVVYVLGRNGRELSGRRVPEPALEMLEDLREGRRPSGMSMGMHRHMRSRPLAEIEIDGQPYVVFATRTDPKLVRIDPVPFNPRYPADVAIVVGLVLTLLVAYVLALYYTRPLRRLDRAMQRFAQGELNTRVSGEIGTTDREIASLAQVFDRMAERIERLVNRQRRLFHDVSHEVRSPLARIEVALELARRDPARVPTSLDRIEKEVGAVDQLIDGLLTYARLDAGEELPLERTELRALLDEVRETAEYEAQKRNITVTLTVDAALENAFVRADLSSLPRAFDNFLRNAIRYTPEGGVIELRALASKGQVDVLCVDQGPGIPEAELESVFNPFVRGAREATGTGFGLGLAIARRIISLHGGSVRAENRTDRTGLIVRTTLPLDV